MKRIEFAINDVVWLGQGVYCDTQAALGQILSKLRGLGYEIEDRRVTMPRSRAIMAANMEEDQSSLWAATLDVDRAKCDACKQYIDRQGL